MPTVLGNHPGIKEKIWFSGTLGCWMYWGPEGFGPCDPPTITQEEGVNPMSYNDMTATEVKNAPDIDLSKEEVVLEYQAEEDVLPVE